MESVTLIEEFRASLRRRNRSASTQHQYPIFVKKFADFVGVDLLTVSKKDLERYIDHLEARNIETNSVQKYLSAISTFYRFLKYREYISENPVPIVREFMEEYKPSDNGQFRQTMTVEQAKP